MRDVRHVRGRPSGPGGGSAGGRWVSVHLHLKPTCLKPGLKTPLDPPGRGRRRLLTKKSPMQNECGRQVCPTVSPPMNTAYNPRYNPISVADTKNRGAGSEQILSLLPAHTHHTGSTGNAGSQCTQRLLGQRGRVGQSRKGRQRHRRPHSHHRPHSTWHLHRASRARTGSSSQRLLGHTGQVPIHVQVGLHGGGPLHRDGKK